MGCLSGPFIFIGYNLFSIRTPRIRKYAKLLKDKRFELENLTGTVEKAISKIGNGEYRNGERGTGNGEWGMGESLKWGISKRGNL